MSIPVLPAYLALLSPTGYLVLLSPTCHLATALIVVSHEEVEDLCPSHIPDKKKKKKSYNTRSQYMDSTKVIVHISLSMTMG